MAEKSRLESELAAISRRMERLRLGPVKDSDDRLCRVLLLGKGDTGKTELIYHLLRYRGDHVDRPIRNNKTYEIRSYSMLHQASFRGVTQPPDVFQASAIELIDYRGQGTSEFFRDLIEQRHEPDHCDFDIIILIVDLFKTPEVKSLAVGKQLEPEQSRIAEQVGHWDADRLSGFVKLSERLKYFCLLINKCDMLETMSTAYDKAFEGYKELRECIKTVGVRNFELVACSLREGWMQHNVEDMPEQDGGIYPFLISRMVGNSTQVRKAERVV